MLPQCGSAVAGFFRIGAAFDRHAGYLEFPSEAIIDGANCAPLDQVRVAQGFLDAQDGRAGDAVVFEGGDSAVHIGKGG